MSNFRIMVAVPGNGTLTEPASRASHNPSLLHAWERLPFTDDSSSNFNRAWVEALNAGACGRFTHLLMLGTDVEVVEDEPGTHYGDRMLQEMQKKGVTFLSVPTRIKDARGVTSCGEGDPKNRWRPWRRYTTADLEDMPLTFTADDVGAGNRFLLHNQHLCLWDLRDRRLQEQALGENPLVFNFTEKIVWEENPWPCEGGQWVLKRESEDWAYSRLLWARGVPTAITRRIKVLHGGLPNWGRDGLYKDGDRDTAWFRNLAAPVPCGEHI